MIKKIVNGILIGFLLLILVGILKKCSGKSNNALEDPITNINLKPKANYKLSKDTFKLVLLNNNPFKTSKIYAKPKKTDKKNKFRVSSLTPSKKFEWPIIEYYGFVKGDQSKDKLALIKLNNKLYRKRENQTIDNFKIKEAHSDSIIIMYNNVSKTILRK